MSKHHTIQEGSKKKVNLRAFLASALVGDQRSASGFGRLPTTKKYTISAEQKAERTSERFGS